MNRVSPMPDEITCAVMGRLRWNNEWQDPLTATRCLRNALETLGVSIENHNVFFLLAASTGLPATELARLHSLRPIIDLTADLAARIPHGKLEGRNIGHGFGIEMSVRAPRLCVQCAEEDVGHWGMSWYRRTHQIRGTDWCEKHGCELACVQARDPFWLVPHAQIAERGTVWVNAHCGSLIQASEFVARYLALMSVCLQTHAPADAETVNSLLVERALSLDIHLEDPRAMSRHIKARAPDAWLARHFPEVHSAGTDHRIAPVDRLLTRTRFAPDGAYTLLAMAALYDDADVAMREILLSKRASSRASA